MRRTGQWPIRRGLHVPLSDLKGISLESSQIAVETALSPELANHDKTYWAFFSGVHVRGDIAVTLSVINKYFTPTNSFTSRSSEILITISRTIQQRNTNRHFPLYCTFECYIHVTMMNRNRRHSKTLPGWPWPRDGIAASGHSAPLASNRFRRTLV